MSVYLLHLFMYTIYDDRSLHGLIPLRERRTTYAAEPPSRLCLQLIHNYYSPLPLTISPYFRQRRSSIYRVVL